MSTAVDFHTQIASIMEALANAAVAEICKVVDDGYAVVHLEMSQGQKENEFLRRKIKLLELQISRYRAERMKGLDGSARLPGVRLLNRQHRETLTSGSSLQGRTRFLNRGLGSQQSQQKTQPINLDQDPDQEVVTTTKTEAAEPEKQDNGELRIVKVEGAVETRKSKEETVADGCVSTRVGDSITSPIGGLENLTDVETTGCSTETEVSGSNIITFVVGQSDKDNISSDITHNVLLELTGGGVRAGECLPINGEIDAIPCSNDKEELENTLNYALPQVWANVSTHINDASAHRAVVKASENVSLWPERQCNDFASDNSVSCNTAISSISSKSSVSDVIVIDDGATSDKKGKKIHRSDVRKNMIEKTNRLIKSDDEVVLPKTQHVQIELVGKSSVQLKLPDQAGSVFGPHDGPGTSSGITTPHYTTTDDTHKARNQENTTAHLSHLERTGRDHYSNNSSHVALGHPVSPLSQRLSHNARSLSYQKPNHSGKSNQRPPFYSSGDHLARIHTAMERPYGCTICTKGFYLEADLHKHMARHTREKPHICEICGKSFVCQSQLDIHKNGQILQSLKSLNSRRCKEENLEEVQEDSIVAEPEGKHSPSTVLRRYPSSGKTEGKEQPSCSIYESETISESSSTSSITQTNSNLPFSFPSDPTSAKRINLQETTQFDIIVIDSLPDKMDDMCDVPLSCIQSGEGGTASRGGRNEVQRGGGDITSLQNQSDANARCQYQPLPYVQVKGTQNSPNEVMFNTNRTYNNCLPTFKNPSVTPTVPIGTVESQEQQTSPLWSDIQQMPDNLSHLSTNHPPSTIQMQNIQPSTSQNQDSNLGDCQSQSQKQQLCLPYGCAFCSRRYAHLCQLRIHERVHTGEKPYQCAQCGKSFAQYCSLKRHQMVHTGERPYRCAQCGKQFSTSNNLKVHQSVHTGEKRFHCSRCGKNFSFLSNLIRHQTIHAAKKN
ncbi:uncharacterized protein LOC130112894 [Lampris incognitus]|uniref:uncharacterized protein LOC130112894 n=1 Tax=Lampris incognitus TaxID=2546036 RepID=UPI0024B5B52D|nr:uncharacterized protein LOC130112894 [Lampris incognitus]